MYLEAKETALLYKLLAEKLGNDTTEAMFKYIDNKTERSVEATIKSLATKDDIADIRRQMVEVSAVYRKELSEVSGGLYRELSEVSAGLNRKIGDLSTDLRKEIGDVSVGLHREISEVKIDLSSKISEASAANIKWMFLFWVGQLGAILGVVFLILKK